MLRRSRGGVCKKRLDSAIDIAIVSECASEGRKGRWEETSSRGYVEIWRGFWWENATEKFG
jgi:hypothetical protein